MKRTIAIIGGDARYLELIRQLQALTDTTLLLIGFDKLEQGFTGLKQLAIDEATPSELDAVILPITGTDSNGMVEPVFSEKQIHLSKNWFQELDKSTLVFSGIANAYLKNAVSKANIKLVPLLDRDDVAIYNSIPTAEGAIMMAIEHTDFTIHSSLVVVVGFGRVGHTVANKFSSLGAKVSVSATHMKDLARVTEMGLTAIPLDRLELHMQTCDLLINTIPAPIIGKEEMKHLPSHAVIIDLASKPGGIDFTYAKQRGIKAMLASSLPSIVAPKTAGKILANVIKQEIMEGLY